MMLLTSGHGFVRGGPVVQEDRTQGSEADCNWAGERLDVLSLSYPELLLWGVWLHLVLLLVTCITLWSGRHVWIWEEAFKMKWLSSHGCFSVTKCRLWVSEFRAEIREGKLGELLRDRQFVLGLEPYLEWKIDHWQIALCEALLLSRVVYSWRVIISSGTRNCFVRTLQRRTEEREKEVVDELENCNHCFSAFGERGRNWNTD